MFMVIVGLWNYVFCLYGAYAGRNFFLLLCVRARITAVECAHLHFPYSKLLIRHLILSFPPSKTFTYLSAFLYKLNIRHSLRVSYPFGE